MFDELLTHDNLGDIDSLGLILFQALNPGQKQNLREMRKFCISQMFSIGPYLNGIIALLKFISFVEESNELIGLNLRNFDPGNFESHESYFKEVHFFEAFFGSIFSTELGKDLFTENNLRFNNTSGRFYVKSHLLSFRFHSLRNLLLRLSFLEFAGPSTDDLYVSTRFTSFFRDVVAAKVARKVSRNRELTLEQLRVSQQQHEEIGRVGELFVLDYEKRRLHGHAKMDQIRRISENFVNAGYDVISFESLDSFVNDRYIEVKTYSNEISFYWSRNEVNVAKELGNNYWLYLVDISSIDDTMSNYSPILFQNPFHKIFESEFWFKETESWKISIRE